MKYAIIIFLAGLLAVAGCKKSGNNGPASYTCTCNYALPGGNAQQVTYPYGTVSYDTAVQRCSYALASLQAIYGTPGTFCGL